MDNSAARNLYDLLVTRDFEPEILDRQGKAISDPSEAEILSFDWKTPEKNYGTVVILLGDENQMEVYYGDNLGRSMEGDDKRQWYKFLEQLKEFAARNLMTFELNNISRLKYTMQGMAAIKEGLFEGYYGKKRISYSDQPQQTRLMIRHNRDLGEGEARYRAIESLFVETAEGERFKLPFKNLMCGRVMARHVAEGGNPYDAFGQHISEIVNEMNTLARFLRASRKKNFSGDAANMVEAAVKHYTDLKAKAKHMISRRGYLEARDAFDPAAVTETEHVVDEIRNMFIEQTLDARIEEALPVLAKLQNTTREAVEFAEWADSVTEGTWALPDTPEAKTQLRDLMSQELLVGPDAINATEQLYDLVGDDQLFDILDDIALTDPDANAWDDPRVMARIQQLVPSMDDTVQETLIGAPMGGAMPSEILEQSQYEPVKIKGNLPKEGDIHSVPGMLDTRMLPGFRDNSTKEDYSDSYYYQDPITKGVFVVYTHGRIPRVRGTDGMPEKRVEEIARSLAIQTTQEDLDCDGVMMTRPSNMSSESREHRELNRLIELAKV